MLKEPRFNRSKILSVVIELDVDEPDEESWIIVKACEGEMPKHFGGGFLHPPKCECNDGRLCDVGWLEEHIACVGTKHLLGDKRPPEGVEFVRLLLVGRMVSERHDGTDGSEWDEYFEADSVTVYRPCLKCHQPMDGKHEPSCVWADVSVT